LSGTPQPAWLAKNLIWFGWPAVPLIAMMLWIRRRGFHGGLAGAGLIIPGVYALWIIAMLALFPDASLMQLLPMLVPLALVASLEVDSWPRGYSAALDWFGILTFGLAAIVLWGFWVDAYFNGMSTRVAILLRDSETGYGTTFHLRAFASAAFLTVLWVVLVRPARRSNRRAVLNWAAGMTLVWGLIATVWLPYVDARRTYQVISESIGIYRPEGACIARRNVGEAQRSLFYYFAGVVTVPESAAKAADCPALLVQYGRLADGTPQLPGYAIQWEGSRRGDASERFVLYRRSQ
jgi:4-amino-4-deoxy-L-arabinose transferase-like glycosyltransferase